MPSLFYEVEVIEQGRLVVLANEVLRLLVGISCVCLEGRGYAERDLRGFRHDFRLSKSRIAQREAGWRI